MCSEDELTQPLDDIQFHSSKDDRKIAFENERKVKFNDDITYHDVPAYGVVFTLDPYWHAMVTGKEHHRLLMLLVERR